MHWKKNHISNIPGYCEYAEWFVCTGHRQDDLHGFSFCIEVLKNSELYIFPNPLRKCPPSHAFGDKRPPPRYYSMWSWREKFMWSSKSFLSQIAIQLSSYLYYWRASCAAETPDSDTREMDISRIDMSILSDPMVQLSSQPDHQENPTPQRTDFQCKWYRHFWDRETHPSPKYWYNYPRP